MNTNTNSFEINRLMKYEGIRGATVSPGADQELVHRWPSRPPMSTAITAESIVLEKLQGFAVRHIEACRRAGIASAKTYALDHAIVVESKGGEYIAVAFPVGHPIAKSLARIIRQCWGAKRTDKPRPKSPGKIADYDPRRPLAAETIPSAPASADVSGAGS